MAERTRKGAAQAYFYRMMAEGDRSAGCWEWPYSRLPKGYGVVGHHGRGWLVHRLAFEHEHGRAPQEARHSCDNPPCFNPAHVLDGTHTDNMRDASNRGRIKGWTRDQRGERNTQAKLTETDVRAIRARLAVGATQTAVAKEFDISIASINLIGHRATGPMWREQPIRSPAFSPGQRPWFRMTGSAPKTRQAARHR